MKTETLIYNEDIELTRIMDNNMTIIRESLGIPSDYLLEKSVKEDRNDK